MINITDIEKAWYAGFYEGEGYICNDVSNSNHIRVGIAQNDKTPLTRAFEIWGGCIRKRIRKSPASDKICTGYEWIINNNRARKFITDITPYLRIPYKMNQIKHTLEIEKEGNTKRHKCKYCSKDYANPSGRRRHERNEHQQNTDASRD